VSTSSPTPTPTPELDPFTCYKDGRATAAYKFGPIPNVLVSDTGGDATVLLTKSATFCAPTDVMDGDPFTPAHAGHLVSYQLKTSDRPDLPVVVSVTDMFNSIGLQVLPKTTRGPLLVPAAEDLGGPPAAPMTFATDHFQCYQIKMAPHVPKFVPVPGVTLQDQFQGMTVTATKPRYLCYPADVDGDDVSAPTHSARLMCYQIKASPKPIAVPDVGLNDEFGPQLVDAKKPAILCVPATTEP